MKVELNIEGPGVQVYCYELDSKRKKELEENFVSMYVLPELWKMENPGKEWMPPLQPMHMVEEYCENGVPTLITHGMMLPNSHKGIDGTVSLSIDGRDTELAGVCTVLDAYLQKDLINIDHYEGCEMGGASFEKKPTNFDECILSFGQLVQGDIRKEKGNVPLSHLLVYRIISYTKGLLTASFEVDDDFKPSHLALVDENPDVATEEEAHYSWNILPRLVDEYRDSIGFDENTLRGVLYKGHLYDFELSFKGGDKFVAALDYNS